MKIPRNINAKKTIGFGKWYKFFRSIRTRLLVWYVVLMLISAVTSIMVIREVLYFRLEKRVTKHLTQQVEEFCKTNKELHLKSGQPVGDDIATIFHHFMAHEVGYDDYFIVLSGGKIYQSPDSKTLPINGYPYSQMLERWQQLTFAEQGKIHTSSGKILYYLVEPVKMVSETPVVFVVLNDATGDWKEVNQAIAIIVGVTAGVIFLTLVPIWVVSGQVLAPLYLLTATARSISESDLTRRIPVKGRDEIAELTITFNEMLQRLQVAFTCQRDFINQVSHELRTPITIIRAYLEMLGDNSPEHSETVQLVTDELDRMSRFVNDLILLAKAEQPNFLTLETVEVGSLAEELFAKARALGPRRWLLEHKDRGIVVCDRHRLTQAVMNLIENAIQQTKTGDVIALGSSVSGNYARFWVRDTGPGIEPEVQQIIFERYIRCPTARRRFEGMGLGLAIVRAIAEAHGGRIELLSTPKNPSNNDSSNSTLDTTQKGSTFTIVIPTNPK